MTETGFGELLRLYRLAAGLTQEELAERSGLSTRGISDLERGARGLPRKDTLKLLLQALDLSPPDRVAFVAAARSRPGAVPQPAERARTETLPILLTPFIGREAETNAISALLSDPVVRLLTLTGAGGTGKTRLALAVAERMQVDYADGAVFVDLAPLRDPRHVLPVVAAAVGLREAPGFQFSDVVRRYFSSHQLLLILDNFEHMLAAVPVVTELLLAGPTLRVLVTSREPLRLRGEQEFPVPAFHLPEAKEVGDPARLATNEAVAFFIDRAQAVRPDFRLSPDNAASIVEICCRLDGLPLALELAAARVKLLPPGTLLPRLDARLPLLTGGARDAPERQRTLRDAIAWSHDLLSEAEARLFRRLGVFVGGWTLEAAEAVTNLDGDLDVLEGLASLMDKSLVRLDEGGFEPRYRMLETIREFAVERLLTSNDESRVRDAHAQYMAGFTHEFDQSMFSANRREWQLRMAAEIPNLRAALSWLADRQDAEQLLILASRSAWAFWERGNVREARDWIESAFAFPTSATLDTRALALAMAAFCAWWQGDNAGAEQLANAGRELSEAGGFEFQAGVALHAVTMVLQEQRDYARSLAVGEEALAYFRRSGNRHWLSQATCDVCISASLAGNVERAQALREEGIALCREVGNMWALAVMPSDLGVEAEQTGDTRAALTYYRESLERLLGLHEEMYVAHSLAGMASIAARVGQAELAARLLGVAAAVHEMRGTTPWAHEQDRDARTATATRTSLGDERFNQEFALGQTLSIAEATCEALDAADAMARALEEETFAEATPPSLHG